jgi:uncharacterized protein (TIGR02271 family)
MSTTVIGLFDSVSAADGARAQLISIGVPADSIRTTGGEPVSQSSGTNTQAVGSQDKSFWASIKEMFEGDESDEADDHLSYYTEGARRGSVVLSAEVQDDVQDRVVSTLQAAGALDVDSKSSEWEKTGWTAPARSSTAATATTGLAGDSGKIDLVKEQLAVGKRVVNRGGVRVIKRTIERPVEQSISLREEKVAVDRRAVDRPLAGADANDAFKDQTFEVSENAEEVVASKTARVVGEVLVGKTAKDRTETVRDTLRETDVKVEQIAGSTAGASSTKTKAIND